MNKRGVIVVAVIGLAAAGAFFMHRNSGPSYQGKSARQWFKELSDNNENSGQAVEAFAAMGTNGTAFLFERLNEALEREINASRPTSAAEHEFLAKFIKEPGDALNAAVSALEDSRIPVRLEQLAPYVTNGDWRIRHWALAAMKPRLGSNDGAWVPPLVAALQETQRGVRSMAIMDLGRLGAAASNATPALINLCGDMDPLIRVDAACCLWRVAHDTNTVVRVLSAALAIRPGTQIGIGSPRWVASRIESQWKTDPLPAPLVPMMIQTHFDVLMDERSRSDELVNACSGLETFGPAAKAAVPALRRLLNQRESWVSNAAKHALQKIDPSATTNAVARSQTNSN